MMTAKNIRTALLVSAVFFAPSSAFSQSAEVAASGSALEDIVVTAQKREQNLQVVPVAVTALTAESLQTLRYQTVNDISSIAPGVTIKSGPGGSVAPAFTARGLYSSTAFASNSATAFYVDGVYQGSSAGTEFELADVERVEVLRGPQGTLFGMNALSGAINIITKEPRGQLRMRQELTAGNRNHFRSKTVIDLPAWGWFSASATYLHDERDGDIRNLGAGTVWRYGPATGGQYGDLVSSRKLGGNNTDAVSATVKIDPGNDIQAVYRFNYSTKDYTAPAVAPRSFTTSAGIGALILPFYLAQDPATRTPLGNSRPDAVNNEFSTPGNLKIQSHSLVLSAEISDNLSVRNLTGYRKMDLAVTSDVAGLGGIRVGAPNNPLLALVTSNESHQKAFSNELQFTLDTTLVKSIFGYLHYYNRLNQGGFDNVPNSAFGTPLFPPPFGAPPYFDFVVPNVGSLRSTYITKSDAFFTQNEIHVTDRLDLVAGIRYTKDSRKGTDGSAVPAGPPIPISFRSNKITWLAGANYRVSDDVFAYVKYSTGYVQGGALAGLTFEPSTAKSLEGGIKADLLDRKLRANLAVYTVDYSNLQIQSSPQNPACSTQPGISLAAPTCIINGGNSRARGVELELTAVPTQGLTLNGNISYTDAKYKSVNPNVGTLSTFGLTYTPKWTGSAGIAYRGNEMSSIRGAHLTGSAQMTYSSSQATSPVSNAAFLTVPATTLVNARLGLAGISVGGAEVEIAGFAKNLFDTKKPTFIGDIGIVTVQQFQPARTFGVDLIVAF